ncbi:hypothetical protein L208DRAFT_1376796 [Tricholoma matsutake]|nr:hypothetical protein L208DRAFT_1376796 [Tricholoma matsutake 945]
MSTPRTISELITNLVSLTESLLASIPNALHDGKINHVLMTVEGEEFFETFNRRFDILFGEHCWGENGRLVHIQHGKYGMDALLRWFTLFNNPKKSQPSHTSKDKWGNVETSCVNKPAPVKAKKMKEKPTKLVDLLDGELLKDDKDNSEDTSYKPPCQQHQLSEESTESYTIGDDGLDIVENSPVQNRKCKVVISSDESNEDGPKPPSHKHQDQKKKKQKKKKKQNQH